MSISIDFLVPLQALESGLRACHIVLKIQMMKVGRTILLQFRAIEINPRNRYVIRGDTFLAKLA